MAILAQERSSAARRTPQRPRRSRHSPLLAPLMVFGAVIVIAELYVTYVLWPRWPDAPVVLDAPSVPIVISGTVFNIEPAAIRMSVQRRPGAHERVDLSYLWPTLLPPNPAIKPTIGAPIDPNERLFITIASGDATLPLIERVQTIYPRFLVAEPVAGPPGLTFRGFRNDSPYQGEDLVFESNAPSIFWRAAHATESPIQVCACWSGASAMPMSLCAFRATGSPIGKMSQAPSIA